MRKIYHSSFQVEPKSNGSNLESLIETSKGWLKGNFRENLDSFSDGIDLNTNDGKKLKTISISEQNKKYFGMSFRHRDRMDKSLSWITELALIEEEDDSLSVDISLFNGYDNGIVKNEKTIISRPRLVPEIIGKYQTKNIFRLFNSSLKVGTLDVDELINVISNPKRKLPVVYISSDKDGGHLVNTERISSTLAGIAHVFLADNHYCSFRMEYHLGKKQNCFNGAVRVYWPSDDGVMEGKYNDIWTPNDLRNKGHILHRELLKLISDRSLRSVANITFEDILNLENSKNIDSLNEQVENSSNEEELKRTYESLLDIYQQDNDQLRSTINNLQIEKEELYGENESLKQRIINLEDNLKLLYKDNGNNNNNNNIGLDINREEHEELEFDSVNDVINYFIELYKCDKRIKILPKATSGAKKSNYENPRQIYNALEWLRTDYYEARTRINNGKNDSPIDLKKSSLVSCDMQYRANQSENTMKDKRYRDDYIAFDGKLRIWLPEHLVKGVSRKTEETIRIGFCFDNNQKKVLVGYVGQHQRNKQSK